jgi:hypothetical protein
MRTPSLRFHCSPAPRCVHAVRANCSTKRTSHRRAFANAACAHATHLQVSIRTLRARSWDERFPGSEAQRTHSVYGPGALTATRPVTSLRVHLRCACDEGDMHCSIADRLWNAARGSPCALPRCIAAIYGSYPPP